MSSQRLSGPIDEATQRPNVPREAWIALCAVASGVFLVALDGTITAVANPRLAADLNASLAQLQWVTNVYLLALGATLVLAGRLGDQFGKKTIFLVGVAGFALASAGIGLSPNIESVIVSRGLQGLFGALIVTNALALLRTTFPIERLPVALAVFSAVIGAATAAGPIVGGLLVEFLNWRWAFLINLPLGVASLTVGLRVLRQPSPERGQGFDLSGTLLLSTALTGLAYGLIRGSEHDWNSSIVYAAFTIGLIAAAAFVVLEQRTRHPLLPLGIFADRNVSIGVLLTLLTFFALVGSMFFLLLFLQQVQGRSPMTAGLALLPMSLMNVAGSSLAGVLTTRYGPRPALVSGMALSAGGFVLLAGVHLDSTALALVAPLAVLGLGLGLVMTSSVQAVLANVDEADAGAAGGVHQTATQIGGLLGTSVLGAVMTGVVGTTIVGELNKGGADVRASTLEPFLTLIAQGGVPALSGVDPDVVRTAASATFVAAMRVTMLVGAAVATLGALAACFVTSRATADNGPHVH